MNEFRCLPAARFTHLGKNGLYFITAIPLLLIQHTAVGTEQSHLGPCFGICPFFLSTLQARMKKLSSETVFSACSLLALFGAAFRFSATNLQVTETFWIFLRASLGGFLLTQPGSPLPLPAFAVVLAVLCVFSQAPSQFQKHGCWKWSSFRVFRKALLW